jgi:DNA-binding transcriptional ArsR family regulator
MDIVLVEWIRMGGSEEETYSIMFTSLRHAARRKILRMLSEKSMTFSQMLDKLGVPGSQLTYHLETLSEFIVKMENGKYTLSRLGEASVSMLKGAEEVESVQTKKFSSLPLRWKSIVAVLMIGIVLLASMSYIQYTSFNHLSRDYELLKDDFDRVRSQNQQILQSSTAERVRTTIRDVVQIDITQYQITLLSNTVETRSDLGGVVEEILKYSLTSSGSKIEIVLRFRDNHFSLYEFSLLEGVPPYDPIFTQPQPTNIIDATKGIIDRYKSSTSDSYLEEMSTLLASANETNSEQTLGNTKLRLTVNGDNAVVLLLYTADGVDFTAKSIRLVFQNHILQELTDDWFFYEVGTTQVNFSKEQAIQIARNATEGFEWNADGETVSNFNVLSEPVSALFFPHSRTEPLILIPYWYITLYLDREYPGGVNSIAVGVWADTGEVANIQALGGQLVA